MEICALGAIRRQHAHVYRGKDNKAQAPIRLGKGEAIGCMTRFAPAGEQAAHEAGKSKEDPFIGIWKGDDEAIARSRNRRGIGGLGRKGDGALVLDAEGSLHRRLRHRAGCTDAETGRRRQAQVTLKVPRGNASFKLTPRGAEEVEEVEFTYRKKGRRAGHTKLKRGEPIGCLERIRTLEAQQSASGRHGE